jgi:hypothetical protein
MYGRWRDKILALPVVDEIGATGDCSPPDDDEARFMYGRCGEEILAQPPTLVLVGVDGRGDCNSPEEDEGRCMEGGAKSLARSATIDFFGDWGDCSSPDDDKARCISGRCGEKIMARPATIDPLGDSGRPDFIVLDDDDDEWSPADDDEARCIVGRTTPDEKVPVSPGIVFFAGNVGGFGEAGCFCCCLGDSGSDDAR